MRDNHSLYAHLEKWLWGSSLSNYLYKLSNDRHVNPQVVFDEYNAFIRERDAAKLAAKLANGPQYSEQQMEQKELEQLKQKELEQLKQEEVELANALSPAGSPDCSILPSNTDNDRLTQQNKRLIHQNEIITQENKNLRMQVEKLENDKRVLEKIQESLDPYKFPRTRISTMVNPVKGDRSALGGNGADERSEPSQTLLKGHPRATDRFSTIEI